MELNSNYLLPMEATMTETSNNETRYLVRDTASGTALLVGCCSHGRDGWRFIPHVSGRKTSRRAWPTAGACIPRWAKSSRNRLLTNLEWLSDGDPYIASGEDFKAKEAAA